MPQRWTTFFAAVVLVVATAVVGSAQPEPIEELRARAEQGDAEAQFSLGINYEYGLGGVPQDQAEAVRWIRLAAEQGDHGAQNILGGFYQSGNGVLQNDAEAVRWWRMAAEQGNLLAYYGLALQYFNGDGVPQDDVFAHMWANLAAAGASDDYFRRNTVALRDQVANRLTPDQRAEAQRLARETDERIRNNR